MKRKKRGGAARHSHRGKHPAAHKIRRITGHKRRKIHLHRHALRHIVRKITENISASALKKAGNAEKGKQAEKKGPSRELVKSYKVISGDIPVIVNIYKQEGEFVLFYSLEIAEVGKITQVILEKIREELINKVNLGIIDITDPKRATFVENKFYDAAFSLVKKYFPGLEKEADRFLTSYIVKKSLGMGDVELLMSDEHLEEIAINSSSDPIWVYHKEFGWLKTNVIVEDESKINHYASMIGRKVNRQITILEPLMDANMPTGDRVNATLAPISSEGNTVTIRKFASKPWTITDLLRTNTLSSYAAALIWECIHYEMSALIAGGTASGKTSMLNAISNFFPPNQRVISIEDTREIKLPKFIHWVPMVTRTPNNEGKGGIAMLDLLVNSLRMRPDRIVVGEIRRQKEAEVLFESIHTGHSVYATVHANNTSEVITRLTSPPIEVPKSMLPAVSLIIVQYRNRRTGARKTFEISEIKDDGDATVLMRYNPSKDQLIQIAHSKVIIKNLQLYTGAAPSSIRKEINEKEKILKWLVKHNVVTVDEVGRVMAEYYTNKGNLMKFVNADIPFR